MLYIKQNIFYYQIRLKLFVIIFHTALSNFFKLCFQFPCLLAVCCMCQWTTSEHTHRHPPSHPVAHTVLPCLLATCLVPAAGGYLSVSARWFLAGWREVTFMSYVYSRAPPPPFFAAGWNMQERHCCRKASAEIPVHSPTDSTVSLNRKILKE